MPFRFLLVAAAASFAQAADAAGRHGPTEDPYRSTALVQWQRAAAEPRATRLVVGDDAPGFSFLTQHHGWQRFFDSPRQGALLLVFGATEHDMLEIERARELFREMGVAPVLVTDRRPSAAGSLARRLGLASEVIADPKCAIGDLYNSLDPLHHRHRPSFFVVDENRTIRAIGHGILPTPIEMLMFSARGLGRPLPESAWTWVRG